MMKREAWLALITLVTFAVGGCGGTSAIIPAASIAVAGAGKAAQAARPINDSEEYYVGRAVAARILGKYKLDQNPKLTRIRQRGGADGGPEILPAQPL